MWKKTTDVYRGIMVLGDEKAPPTKWWNHWWLALWGWKKFALFSVAYVPSSGYLVGFCDVNGNTYIQHKWQTSPDFRVRIGHEPCVFFAINAKGEEIVIDFKGSRRTARPTDLK